MMYHIAAGTVGKLVKVEHNKDAEINDWVTRKDLTFQDCLVDPTNVSTVGAAFEHTKKPLAIRLAEEGFSLFGGVTGGDRQACYVLAIPYPKITTHC